MTKCVWCRNSGLIWDGRMLPCPACQGTSGDPAVDQRVRNQEDPR